MPSCGGRRARRPAPLSVNKILLPFCMLYVSLVFMNVALPITASADTAATDPSPGREICGLISDEAEQARTARHLVMLQELAEIGMNLARAVGQQAATADPGEAALQFGRIARAVRQTLALEAKLAEEYRTLTQQSAAERAAQAQRAAEAAQQRLARRRDKVKHVTERLVREREDRPTIARLNEVLSDLDERLKDIDDTEFGDRPIGAIIAGICRDLDIEPDWDRWATHRWAVEEAQTNAPGSPYAVWSDTAAAEDQTLPADGPSVCTSGSDPP
jgi:hypothetical protein